MGNAQVFNTNKYFLDSANTVSFFFEEKAFKDNGQTLQQAKALSINKIGHGDCMCFLKHCHGVRRPACRRVGLCVWPYLMSGLLAAALHDLDPAFRRFSRSEKVAQLIHSLGLQQPLPVQSMYIFKVCRPRHVATPVPTPVQRPWR